MQPDLETPPPPPPAALPTVASGIKAEHVSQDAQPPNAPAIKRTRSAMERIKAEHQRMVGDEDWPPLVSPSDRRQRQRTVKQEAEEYDHRHCECCVRVHLLTAPPRRLATLPAPWLDDHAYVLSRRLVHHLDERNPALMTVELAQERKTLWKLDPTVELAPFTQPCRWLDCVVLRTPAELGDRTGSDDLLFLQYLLPGFAQAMRTKGDLVVRLDSMTRCRPAILTCLRSIDHPFEEGVRHTLDGWFVRELIYARDRSVPSAAKRVFTYSDDDHGRAKWSCGVPADELRPLWYLVLAEQGYATGAPNPNKCPKLADPACLPDLVVLRPDRIGLYTEGLRAEISDDRLLTPEVFVSMLKRLDHLASVKLQAMRDTLARQAPQLSILIIAGFGPELLQVATQLRSYRLGDERIQMALRRKPTRSGPLFNGPDLFH